MLFEPREDMIETYRQYNDQIDQNAGGRVNLDDGFASLVLPTSTVGLTREASCIVPSSGSFHQDMMELGVPQPLTMQRESSTIYDSSMQSSMPSISQ